MSAADFDGGRWPVEPADKLRELANAQELLARLAGEAGFPDIAERMTELESEIRLRMADPGGSA